MKVIDGGQPQLRKGDRVLVYGRNATVICPDFKTHVYRGMVSVDFGHGELGMLQRDEVLRTDADSQRNA